MARLSSAASDCTSGSIRLTLQRICAGPDRADENAALRRQMSAQLLINSELGVESPID